ncbi:MAG: LysR family transcriptional regulator [Oligoflexia bacterium]|nr:LysR family transcriptional regulator [Oligoflexia bacterium]
MKNINLNRLYYFHTFVRKKNVAGAAKELLISQPALSAQLKILETELDMTLFDRSNRSLELTKKGEHLHYYTRQIFETCEHMLNELDPKEADQKQSFRIGISDQIERNFCVKFISELYQENIPSDVKRFNVTNSNHETLIKQLKEGIIDYALSKEKPLEEGIRAIAKIDMPVVLAIPKSYRGHKTPAISEECIKALQNQEFNMVIPSTKLNLRKNIDNFLIQKNIFPKVILESDILSILTRAIADGLGVGFFPVQYLSAYSNTGKIKISGLPNGYWKETLWLLTNLTTNTKHLNLETKSIFKNSFTENNLDFA